MSALSAAASDEDGDTIKALRARVASLEAMLSKGPGFYVTVPRSLLERALSTLEGWGNYDDWVWPDSALSTAKENTTEIVPELHEALTQSGMDHPISAPQGWKLVPSTFTAAQRQAAQDAWWNACNAEMYWDRIYAAMLDAAPQPPVVEQGQAGYMRWKNGSAEYVSKKGFDTPIDELWHPVYIYPQDKPDRLQIRKRIQDAFFEGFNSVETYNDTRLVSIDEAWKTYVESVTDL